MAPKLGGGGSNDRPLYREDLGELDGQPGLAGWMGLLGRYGDLGRDWAGSDSECDAEYLQ